MKAAQISQYGPAENVKVVDIEQPSIGEGQVLIAVHAASINPWDSKVRNGDVQGAMPLELPVTLGGDLAGVVQAVGANVTAFKVGDKVYGQTGQTGGNTGAFAEYAAVNADTISIMPTNLDFPEAAAAPLTGVSAIQGLQEHLNLQTGQKILIHGGAGGIGTMAIQIAKHMGAYVATTATGDGLDYVKQLGADEVIDYKTQQFDELLTDYDAVFDLVGGESYGRSFKVLKQGGAIVSMLMPPNQQLMEQYGVQAIHEVASATTAALQKLATFIEEGTMSVHVDKTYPLEQVADAFTAWESGGVHGKVVLAIQ